MKKKPALLIVSAIIALLLTSMMIVQTKNLQDINKEKTENPNPDAIQQAAKKVHEGMITIKLKKGVGDFTFIDGNVAVGIPSLDTKLSKFKVSLLKKRFTFNPEKYRQGMPDLSRIYQINFPPEYNIWTVVRSFSNDPNVEYAEPIPVNYKCEIPDDELYDQMYHLTLISADLAWDIHKGENGPEVIIGIVDDAVDWRHIDLVENVWENLGEDADGDGHVIQFNGTDWIFDPDDENGIDDDGNGKVDDFVGWDFLNENGEQDNDPTPNSPSRDHGTHCIGIANARTNNMSFIASIAWNVKFMTAKVCNNEGWWGDGHYNAYEALIYVAEQGVDIITNSWAAPSFSKANMEAIEYAQSLGCIVVAAAGNENSEILMYPASYPGVISVAATNQFDYTASYTSFGIGIDICAPGINILSLKPNNSTRLASGTSMSTPMVAGLLALTKSYYPGWSNDMIINQVLGTADDIDNINQNYANKLGQGRINAYRALSETNVTTRQELKLSITNPTLADENSNGINEPGEMVYLGFELRNFAVGVDTTAVTFSLSTNSPYVSLINNEMVLNVPADNFIKADSAFLFQVNNDIDSVRLLTLTITAESTIPIPLDNEWTVEVLLNQSGILVFDGIGSGNAYSGAYIRDFLQDSVLPVFYTESFPPSLNGFDAVFLSFGNYGQGLSNGTMITPEMTTTITDYLYNGGYLYEDCGTFFGSMAYSNFQNLEEMEDLFGVDTVITPMIANSINLLNGLPGSVAEGLSFSGSSQFPNYYIDIMTPDSNGMAIFEEEDYGIVAVQGEGEYGQRTICFSYAIAHLNDDTLGSRDELMLKIAEFFQLFSLGLEEPTNNNEKLVLNNYPNPVNEISNIEYLIPDIGYVVLGVYNIQGKEISKLVNETQAAGQYKVRFDTSALPAGIYFIRLQTGNKAITKKIMKL
jgi:serine protease